MKVTRRLVALLLCIIWVTTVLLTLGATHLQMLEVANPTCGSLRPEYCEEYLGMIASLDLTYEKAFTYTLTILGLIIGLPATILILWLAMPQEEEST